MNDDGNIVSDAHNLVTFDFGREGKITGVAGGHPLSHEDHKSNGRWGYNGKCLVLMQSTGQPGQIRSTTTSSGFAPSSLSLISLTKREDKTPIF